jgi:hypothetical protein
MDLNEFVSKIITRFPPQLNGGDTLESFISEFTQALQISGIYNYEEAFIELWRNYSFKTTPTPKIVIEILKRFQIKTEVKETPEEYDTIIVRKGKYDYEYGVKLADYQNDIEYFKRNGFNIIKLKYCDKDCMKCYYNHVCLTAAEKRA